MGEPTWWGPRVRELQSADLAVSSSCCDLCGEAGGRRVRPAVSDMTRAEFLCDVHAREAEAELLAETAYL